MSEKEKLEKLQSFIATLSDAEARHELLLSYQMMERCRDIIDGKDVEPVTMKENGLDSDLELFYMCKKLKRDRDELDELRKNTAGTVAGAIKTIDSMMEEWKNFKASIMPKLDKVEKFMKENC